MINTGIYIESLVIDNIAIALILYHILYFYEIKKVKNFSIFITSLVLNY